MAIGINVTPHRLTVSLSGEIDHHNAAALRLETDDAIQSMLCKKVTIDFGEVSFMDSSGIGFVMGRYRIVSSYAGELEVINLSERIYKMMKLAGLDKLVRLSQKNKRKDK